MSIKKILIIPLSIIVLAVFQTVIKGEEIYNRNELIKASAWQGVLSRHTLVYERAAKEWHEGVPIGNGDMGMMIWGDGNPLIFTLDKSDIWEKRHWEPDPEKFKWRRLKKMLREGNTEQIYREFMRPRKNRGNLPENMPEPPFPTRLPVGRAELHPVGKVQSLTMKLDIFTATALGKIITDKGSIVFSAFVHAVEPVIIVEFETTGEESGAEWKVYPFNTPGAGFDAVVQRFQDWGYPPINTGRKNNVNFWRQTIPEQGEYATAWTETKDSDSKASFWLSIRYTQCGPGADTEACEIVSRYCERDIVPLKKSHNSWWAQYYRASFLSIPDTRLEALYWIEMYKFASCTQPDGMPLALGGTFSEDGCMPRWSGDYHWNINVQMTYWSIYTSNHLDFGMPLYNMIDRSRYRLRKFAREVFERDGEFLFHATDPDLNPVYDGPEFQFEFNGGLWVGHHFWMHWLYSQDKDFLRTRAMPYIKEVLRPILDELEQDENGVFHLPLGGSPEYTGSTGSHWGPDCTCDLAFIKFGCKALLEACGILGISDLEQDRWRDVLEHLAPYPLDDWGGLAVRADLKLETSHRHHSHLIPYHPLHLLTIENDREIVSRSLRRLAFTGHGEWVGFSWGWAASIAAFAEKGNLARSLLLDYTDRWVGENTFMLQGPVNQSDMSIYGTYALTLEAGFGAANAVQDMLIQSYDGMIKLFPAIPNRWQDVSFWSLRTEGAFLVSAARKEGKLQFVHVHSEAGGRCTLRGVFPDNPHVENKYDENIILQRDVLGDMDEIQFDTDPRDEIVIWFGDIKPVFTITPAPAKPYECHFFGTKQPSRF